jgi:hypothetical protein
VTKVRWLMWGALAVASVVVVAVVATAIAPSPAPRAAPIAKPLVAAAPPTTPPSRGDRAPAPDAADPPGLIDRRGVPVDPDGVGRIPGVVPSAELGDGDATLRLLLLAYENLAPVAMPVRLWRLGVPESETWTEGDQVQAEFDVGETGVQIEHLPAGRYRVECRDPRPNSTDPPEFVVADGENAAAVPVMHRRSFRLRLRLVDADGAAVRQAKQRPLGGGGTFGSGHSPPSWASPRVRKGRGPDGYGFGGFGTGCGRSGPRKTVVADADGFFDLGTIRERGVDSHSDWTDELAADGAAAVVVSMDDATPVDSTYVAVAPRLDVLVAHVKCPDGSALDPKTAKIEATSNATRCAWTPPADTWRTVQVDVKVVRDGCEALRFLWSAETADVEHRLVAVKAGGAK